MTDPNFKADLRWHETGELTDRTVTSDPAAAETAFRQLLARDDLTGERVAARLVSPFTRKAIYYSAFDKTFGHGRIHPDAPLDLFASEDQSKVATVWVPPPRPVIDWEADDRSLADCLKDWHRRPGWTRDTAAAELRVPRSTYDGWCAGRSAALEPTIRRLMTMIDRLSPSRLPRSTPTDEAAYPPTDIDPRGDDE